MQAPTKLNFKIYQGSTFSEVLRWESSTIKYATITGITQAAPCVIAATAHGVPAGWRFQITNVAGMTELNSTENHQIASAVTTDTITMNAVNSLGYKAYTTGGVVSYNMPVDLTGYTARMQIRAKITDTAPLEELTTVNGKIQIDTIGKSIILLVDAPTTAAYTFSSGVYSLEMVSPTGVVTQLTAGTITLIKEVTR
jgi:allophanate hydrolase subunit 2